MMDFLTYADQVFLQRAQGIEGEMTAASAIGKCLADIALGEVSQFRDDQHDPTFVGWREFVRLRCEWREIGRIRQRVDGCIGLLGGKHYVTERDLTAAVASLSNCQDEAPVFGRLLSQHGDGFLYAVQLVSFASAFGWLKSLECILDFIPGRSEAAVSAPSPVM